HVKAGELVGAAQRNIIDVAGAEAGVAAARLIHRESHQSGAIHPNGLQEVAERPGLGAAGVEAVNDLDLAIDQLGQQGVAIGLAARLLGHVEAVILAGLALGLGVPAPAEEGGLLVAVASAAGALLLIDLAAGAFDQGAIERAGGALAQVRVIANVRLLDESRVHFAAE